MQQRIRRVCGAALIGALTSVAMAPVASAEDMKPDRYMKYRNGLLRAMGWQTDILGAMVKGDKPFNKDEFLMRANWVDQLTRMPWEAFPPGTDRGGYTKAKPEIWKEPAKFKQQADAMQVATAKLVTAAKLGTLDAVKGPFGEMTKACDICHDDFKAK